MSEKLKTNEFPAFITELTAEDVTLDCWIEMETFLDKKIPRNPSFEKLGELHIGKLVMLTINEESDSAPFVIDNSKEALDKLVKNYNK